MTRITDYLVMSTDPRPGNHDLGAWTQHSTLGDAKGCADSVRGRVWRRTINIKDDGSQSETMRRVS